MNVSAKFLTNFLEKEVFGMLIDVSIALSALRRRTIAASTFAGDAAITKSVGTRGAEECIHLLLD